MRTDPSSNGGQRVLIGNKGEREEDEDTIIVKRPRWTFIREVLRCPFNRSSRLVVGA